MMEMGQAVTSDDSNVHGVSWPAVIAGAFVTAALSLILLALGAGIGLSAISPWENSGASTSAVGAGAIVWLVLVQLVACSMGGYLAGRLRTKWIRVHTHEVYFRDTAHGFLVWAVSVVVAAAFLASAAASMIGKRHEAGSANQSGGTISPNQYFADELLRSRSPGSNDASARSEVDLILANALRQGTVPPADRSYLVDLTAAKTGISEADADKRVSNVFAQAQQAADQARKAVAHSLYWTFLALLVGAFCASFAATIGGRQRDHVIVI